MHKQKTHKGLKKRVKITASGKVRRYHAGGSHLMSVKNAKKRRKIATPTIFEGALADKFRAMLGK